MTRLPPPPTHDVLILFSNLKCFPKNIRRFKEINFKLIIRKIYFRLKERKKRGGVEHPSQTHLPPLYFLHSLNARAKLFSSIPAVLSQIRTH